MNYGMVPIDNHALREVTILDLIRKRSPRIMRSSVSLPSQQQAYAVCVEFAKKWFLEKFKENYFNSVYINTTHSFDEFRKFASINEQMKRTNPLLSITPTIDINHNRQWIDSLPEIPLMLKRSRIEGSFFNDIEKGLHLQLIFKSILMNFTYKIRVDTRGEELDMVEFLKLNHRAGWTESREVCIDVHVPKSIMLQIAFDNGFKIDTVNGEILEPLKLLNYLNSHSYIPFIYKLRCATGNKEFFIKVPNCMVHIKTEMPNMDDGERQDHITVNYNIDMQVEMEMSAPYCYTYFSQEAQPYIMNAPQFNNYGKIAIMAAKMTEIPCFDENGWEKYTTTEYQMDENEIVNGPICIDFRELFNGVDMEHIINYTKAIAASPSLFMNFKMFNDGYEIKYSIDWDTMICTILDPINNCNIIIGIYCDKEYINNTLLYLKDADKKSARVE